MRMRFEIFLLVASIVAVVTNVIGLALIGSRNWHFTILDVAADVGAGLVFGLLAQAMSSTLCLREEGFR